MELEAVKRSIKRPRSENWLEEDKILLKELVRERVSIIENKNTDTNTNSEKVAAWTDLQNCFNCVCKGTQRTVIQLKNQWGHMKLLAKKQNPFDRKTLFQTGGGTPSAPPPATKLLNSSDNCVWLPNKFTIHTNEFDSDQTNQDNDTKINIDESSTIDEPSMIHQCIAEDEGVIAPSQEHAHRPANKKKKKDLKMSPAERIAENDIQCRRELHRAQMINEQTKAAILNAENNLIKIKSEYYKKKMKLLLLQ